MNRSTPLLPIHHQLPEFTETHVHRVSDAIQPSHPLSSPSPPAPNESESFPMSQLFAWGGQSTGVSALASFLPKISLGYRHALIFLRTELSTELCRKDSRGKNKPFVNDEKNDAIFVEILSAVRFTISLTCSFSKLGWSPWKQQWTTVLSE